VTTDRPGSSAGTTPPTEKNSSLKNSSSSRLQSLKSKAALAGLNSALIVLAAALVSAQAIF
jgi:hypothetical protein